MRVKRLSATPPSTLPRCRFVAIPPLLNRFRLGEMMPCKGVTKDGKPCSAGTQRESEWCVFHDPEKSEVVAEARRKGGSVARDAHMPVTTPLFALRTASDVIALCEIAANLVLTGELDTKRGSTIAYLSTVTLRAIETRELQDRLDRLEEQVNSK